MWIAAKIVFLTLHQDDDFVSKAIRCGAMGYVLKMLASSNLTPALHHALAGRRYLPSLTPLVMHLTDTQLIEIPVGGLGVVGGAPVPQPGASRKSDPTVLRPEARRQPGVLALQFLRRYTSGHSVSNRTRAHRLLRLAAAGR